MERQPLEPDERAARLIAGYFEAAGESWEAAADFAGEVVAPAVEESTPLARALLHAMAASSDRDLRAVAATFFNLVPKDYPVSDLGELVQRLLADDDAEVAKQAVTALLYEDLNVDVSWLAIRDGLKQHIRRR